MGGLPALEGDYEEAATPSTSKAKSPSRYNIEKKLDKVDLQILKNMDYPRPYDFFDTDTEKLEQILDEVKNDVKSFTGQINGLNKKKIKQKKTQSI